MAKSTFWRWSQGEEIKVNQERMENEGHQRLKIDELGITFSAWLTTLLATPCWSSMLLESIPAT